MKKAKQVTAFFLAALIAASTVPAYAEEQSASTAYTVSYSQVEQLVLNNNLHAQSNGLTVGMLDDESELKKKYDKISDTLSQTSASLTAIINNPQTSSDLKTVAQGTEVTISSLSEMLNSQEEANDDDYELTELQVALSNNQLVKSAQSMFSVYYQLQYNIGQLKNTRALLEDSLNAAQTQYELKLVTSTAVTDSKTAISTLDNNITDLQNQSKSIGYQMNQLLGHSYNDQITFGDLPVPDTAYVGKINLTNDIATAQAASYKVKISLKERSILGDDTTTNRDKRQIKSNEAQLETENVGASLESQYSTITKQQAVLATEQNKLANAKLKFDQAKEKYDLGYLSKMEFDKMENDYLTEELNSETASATLFWNIESYKWIVKGLPTS